MSDSSVELLVSFLHAFLKVYGKCWEDFKPVSHRILKVFACDIVNFYGIGNLQWGLIELKDILLANYRLGSIGR